MSDFPQDDDVLVQSALQGDHTAFAQIVEKYRDKIYSVCYVHVMDHEEALDLVQDVFLAAYQKLDTLRQWNRLGPFLATIARNSSINRIRIRKRHQAIQERMEQRANVDEHLSKHELSEAERNDLHAVLRVLIKTLPANSREVVLLHYFQGMTTAEIADFLSVRQAAVLQRLHYGRKLLRTRMELELKPALENDNQRKNHIQGIIAAIPFGSAPWVGKPLPVQAKPWPLKRPVSIFKSGAAGVGLAAAAVVLVVLWRVLMYPHQPNPSGRSTTGLTAAVAPTTHSPAPGDTQAQTEVARLTPEDRRGLPPTPEPSAPSASEPERIRLVFGSPPWAPPQGSRDGLNALIKAYAQIEPGVTIELAPDRVMPSIDAVTRADVGDIIIDESLWIGGSGAIARLRALDAIVPLDSFIAQDQFDFADYYPNVQELVTDDRQTWGLPFAVVSWAFAIPPTLEEEPWIAEQLKSWDRLPDVLASLWVEMMGDDAHPLSAAWIDPSILWTCLFLRAGGDLNDIDSLAPDSPAAQKASTEFWQLFERNPPAFRPYSKPDEGAVDLGFMVVTDAVGASRSLQTIQRQLPGVQIVGAPNANAISPTNTHVLAITRSTPEKERAAWRFVRWLCSADVIQKLHEDQGMLPLRISLKNRVQDPAQLVLLEQIQRMQFQKPDVERIAAFRRLWSGIARDVRLKYEAYQDGTVPEGVAAATRTEG